MRLFSLLFFTFALLSANAQRQYAINNRYAKGQVYLDDGKVIDCEIAFPIINRTANIKITARSKTKITIKNYQSGQTQKLSIVDIDSIKFQGEDEYYVMFAMQNYRFNNKGKKKLSDEKYWFIKEHGCEELQGFVKADRYDLNRKGKPYAIYDNTQGEFLLKKPEEDYPTYISWALAYKGLTKRMLWKTRKKMFTYYIDTDAHAQNFLEGKKRLSPKEFYKYLAERCQ